MNESIMQQVNQVNYVEKIQNIYTLLAAGRFDELSLLLSKNLEIDPYDTASLFGTALIYKALKDYTKAIEIMKLSGFEQVQEEIFWNELGECQSLSGNNENGIDSFKKSLSVNPQFIQAAVNLAAIYLNQREYSKAIEILTPAWKQDPRHPDINLYLAYATHRLTLNPLHISPYIEAAIKVDNSKLATALSLAFLNAESRQDLKQMQYISDKLMHSFPQDEHTWVYKAHLCFGEKDPSKGLSYLKKATEVAPRSNFAHDKLIMMAHYSPLISNEEILRFAENYYEKCTIPFLEDTNVHFNFSQLINNFKMKDSKIRVGLVSADFKMHPVFFWISSLLKFTPENSFEIYCYANNLPNEFSESLIPNCEKLEYIHHLSDIELAKKIYTDKVHVLIDLSGHTAGNRLNTFALKPAPLQITWLGQSGPMGLPQIDYMLADSFLVKNGEEKFFTEKIYRMPNLFAPYPAGDYQNLEINKSLARNDGTIVLGSFNHGMKINSETLETWAEILKSVPDTVLILKNGIANNENYQKNVLEIFNKYGVSSSRLIFEGASPKHEYLKTFNKVDIALDPIPVGGGTTTHETLMMSVPLVSLRGNRVAFRGSAGVLEMSGFPELIANTKEVYTNKIIKLASSPEEILRYKSIIREKYLSSPATDMKTFSQDFFSALKELLNKKLNSEDTHE